MNHASTATATARTLDVPGARLHYELRGDGPVVVLVGAPMDAKPFEQLADRLAADYTVLTTDPRGISRSPVDDPDQDSTPEMRAERHAGNEEAIAKWLAGDHVGSWRVFLDNADITLPVGVFETMFAGERDPQEIANTTFQNTHMLRPTSHWRPDITTLRSTSTRIVVGVGEDSAGQVCDRTSTALAAALGIELTMFPGGHVGFIEDPDGFATRLRAVLRDG